MEWSELFAYHDDIWQTLHVTKQTMWQLTLCMTLFLVSDFSDDPPFITISGVVTQYSNCSLPDIPKDDAAAPYSDTVTSTYPANPAPSYSWAISHVGGHYPPTHSIEYNVLSLYSLSSGEYLITCLAGNSYGYRESCRVISGRTSDPYAFFRKTHKKQERKKMPSLF